MSILYISDVFEAIEVHLNHVARIFHHFYTKINF